MPYILAHTFFGYEALEALGKDPESFSPAFYLGCCGPDPYFFYHPLHNLLHKGSPDLGHFIHGLPGDKLFAAMLPAIDKTEQEFLWGMVCHLCLDAAAHPYITSRTRGMDHSRMEVEIDMQLYATAGSCTLAPTLRQKGADLDRLDLYMARTVEKLIGRQTLGKYRSAARTYLTLQHMSYDPSGSKRRIVSLLEAPFTRRGTLSGFMMTPGVEDTRDAMNRSHTPWRSPRQPELLRRESFTELFDQGLMEAVRCLRALERGDTTGFLAMVSRFCMEYGPVAPQAALGKEAL